MGRMQRSPSHQLGDLGECCKLPQQGPWWSPGCKRILGIEEPRIRLKLRRASVFVYWWRLSPRPSPLLEINAAALTEVFAVFRMCVFLDRRPSLMHELRENAAESAQPSFTSGTHTVLKTTPLRSEIVQRPWHLADGQQATKQVFSSEDRY